MLPAWVGDVKSVWASILGNPPVFTAYSKDTKYFVVLVSVILLAPENVNTVDGVTVEAVTVSDVARAAPVGTPVEPNVPVWAYM
jgi:hypothetical protein